MPKRGKSWSSLEKVQTHKYTTGGYLRCKCKNIKINQKMTFDVSRVTNDTSIRIGIAIVCFLISLNSNSNLVSWLTGIFLFIMVICALTECIKIESTNE